MKGVVAVTPADQPLAETLASAWGVAVVDVTCCVATELYGWVECGWIGLFCATLGKKPLYLDFVTGPWVRRTQQLQTEPVLQAIGYKPGWQGVIWDVTAGLGRESFLFASAGLQVVSFERNPIVHALLDNGLARLHANTPLSWNLYAGDARTYLQTCTEHPDVVYLDPMFPARTKTAVVKKEMRFLQSVLVEDHHTTDEVELLRNALAVATKRVVVKRPLNAESITLKKPSGEYISGAYRWDIYAPSLRDI